MDFQVLDKNFKVMLELWRYKPVLEGFTGVDMAGDLNGWKSTPCYLFTFAGVVVSWKSKL